MWTKLFVLALVACAAATPVEDGLTQTTTDPKEMQMYIMKLLNHVLQPVMYKDIEQLGTNYKIEDHIEQYTQPDVVKRLITRMKMGVLPRGEIFTINIDRQMEEVIDMFHVLYYAKDFPTFIRTASWMRINFNEGMFVYALTVAVRHREDTQNIVLPAPYEVYPYYFVRADVIQKAYMLKMKKGMIDQKMAEFYGIKKTENDVYVIDENPQDTRVTLNDEDRLRYFTEDIDLNTYYFYFHVDYPFWMRDDVYNKMQNRRGELVLYVYQQILARYYLERLSNDMPEIPTLTWDQPIKQGYWPWLTQHNGVEIPARFDNYVISREYKENIMRLVEDYETIIREAIIKGYITTHDGVRLDLTSNEDLQNLAQLVYGGTTYNKYYKDVYSYLMILMNSLLGLNTITSDKYFVVPSALDNYQTALRDPVFYQLQKRLISNFLLFKKRLPSYTQQELYFPGVKIDNVSVDKLVTYFDDHLMDITNAIILDDQELQDVKSSMTFMVRKRRLNHNTFKITLEITSDKTVDSVVRIFLGPKEDRHGRLIDINQNRQNFVEIDSFLYKLKTGKNTVMRNSNEMHNLVDDRMMAREMMTKINAGTDMNQLLQKELRNMNTGYPQRLLLPRGRVGGLKTMLYVIVTPLKQVEGVDLSQYDINTNDLPVEQRSTVMLDKMPLGFPLDRHIDVTKFFTPNMKFIDVTVFHKPQVSDMQTRWNRYVLSHYGDRTSSVYGGENTLIDANTEERNTTV